MEWARILAYITGTVDQELLEQRDAALMPSNISIWSLKFSMSTTRTPGRSLLGFSRYRRSRSGSFARTANPRVRG
jgi:hypothetical protein